MKESLIDTDILSYYMRGLRDVVPRAQEYLKQFGCFNVSSLTVFEILKGLFWKTGQNREGEATDVCGQRKNTNVSPVGQEEIFVGFSRRIVE